VATVFERGKILRSAQDGAYRDDENVAQFMPAPLLPARIPELGKVVE
jgi:hypothetical protein